MFYRKNRFHPLTPDQFADQLDALRPRLLLYICRTRPCSEEDAEDLLQDTILYALTHLAGYDAETGTAGLVAWLREMASIIILRDRKANLHQPSTVPLIFALPLPSCPSVALADAVRPHIRLLPMHLQTVVCDHLDGYSQQEIAWRNRIHRNTVANRMELASQQLRCAFPDFEGAWDKRFFHECSQHATYTRQNDMTSWWMNHHPSERQRAHTEKRRRIAA